MKNLVTVKSRALRNNATEAEKILWQHLRRQQLGLKFRRQQPLRLKIQGRTQLFIADFYCREAKLVIEVDGKIHARQKDYDEARDHLINQLGFQILRVTNEIVIGEIATVVVMISKLAQIASKTPLSPVLGKGAGG